MGEINSDINMDLNPLMVFLTSFFLLLGVTTKQCLKIFKFFES